LKGWRVVKAFVILVCASLSSCALVGVYGPERKAIAQENLRKIPALLAQVPLSVLNAYGNSGGDYSYSGDNISRQLNQIQQDANWNQMRLRQQLQANEMQAEGAALIRENQAQWERGMQQTQEGLNQFLQQLTPLP
jgi:hypothetical protein